MAGVLGNAAAVQTKSVLQKPSQGPHSSLFYLSRALIGISLYTEAETAHEAAYTIQLCCRVRVRCIVQLRISLFVGRVCGSRLKPLQLEYIYRLLRMAASHRLLKTGDAMADNHQPSKTIPLLLHQGEHRRRRAGPIPCAHSGCFHRPV